MAKSKKVLEVRPIHEFHGDVSDVLILADLIDRNDPRVIQASGSAGFAKQSRPQPVQLFAILISHKADHFDRDRTTQEQIDAAIDCAHPSSPDRLEQFEMA